MVLGVCTPRSDPGKAMFEKRERAAVVEDRGTSSQREQETSCRLLIRMHPFRKAVSSCPPHISSPTLLHYILWLTSVWDSSQTKAQLNCRYFSIPTPIIQNLLGLQKKKKRTPWAPNSCSPWQRGTQPRVYKYFEIESMKAMVLFLILNFFT